MQTTTSLTHDQAQHILTQAKAAGAAKSHTGQYNAALRALERNDLDAFERVCRYIHVWLAKNGIDYKLTDGQAEGFYIAGTLSFRCTYKDGELHALAEWFRPDSTLMYRRTYKDGQIDGLAEWFRPDGALEYQHTYKDGVLQ
jgi:hypothetical protein